MKQNFFSLKTWMFRFVYAIQGLAVFFKTEHNAVIYLLATTGILLLSLFTHVSAVEAMALVIVTGLVWIAELFNTAIERLSDLISPQRNAQVKIIKDVAAAAVLLSALMALATALIIFIPKNF